MARPEIYVSTDIESDGPIPGPHSMLSFASAAYQADGTLLGTFSANLELLPGASGHPRTMAWWATQPAAWAACRRDCEAPTTALPRYVAWLKKLPGKPVFVGWPVTFDFGFVHWYIERFADENPFGFAALDAKTLAMAVLGGDYRAVSKRRLPAEWSTGLPHTHVALDDALEQGAIFCQLLARLRGIGSPGAS